MLGPDNSFAPWGAFCQTAVLQREIKDPRLQVGVCFSLCIEWAECLCKGQAPTAAFLESRIFTVASRQRAYIGHYSQSVRHATDTSDVQMQKILDVSWKYIRDQARDYGRRAQRVCFNVRSLIAQQTLALAIRQHAAVFINCVWPENVAAPARHKAHKNAAAGHAMICAWNGGAPLFFDPNMGQAIDDQTPSPHVAAKQVMEWVDRKGPEYGYDLYGWS